MKKAGAALVVLVAASLACGSAHAYSWPVKPFDKMHAVRGAFDDPRYHLGAEGALSAFHFGVDIAVKDGTPVYSVSPGYVRSHPDNVSVRRPGSGRDFGYWHIHPVVHTGQHVDEARVWDISSCGKDRAFDADGDVTEEALARADRRLKLIVKDGGPALAFSPDGTSLVTAYYEEPGYHVGVKLWSLDTGQEQGHLHVDNEPGELFAIKAMAFSPDGRTLAVLFPTTLGVSCRVKLLEIPTGRELGATGPLPCDFILDVEYALFTPDRRALVTGLRRSPRTESGHIRLWDVPPQKGRPKGALGWFFAGCLAVIALASVLLVMMGRWCYARLSRKRPPPAPSAPDRGVL